MTFRAPLTLSALSGALLLSVACGTPTEEPSPEGERIIEATLPAGSTGLLALDANGRSMRAEPTDGVARLTIDSDRPVVLFVAEGDTLRSVHFERSAGGALTTTVPNHAGTVTVSSFSTCDCDGDGTEDELEADDNPLAQIDTDGDGESDYDDNDDDDDGESDDDDDDDDGNGEADEDDEDEAGDSDGDGVDDEDDEDDDNDGVDDDEDDDDDDDGVEDDEEEDDDEIDDA
jgi:hypothetical protein